MGVVLKFGGSSLKTSELMLNSAKKIIENKNKHKNVVVVVSAMGSMTNELINEAKINAKYPNKRELDALLVTGELKSASLMAITLNGLGYKAISLNAFQAGIYTSGSANNNKIEFVDEKIINNYLNDDYIVVIPGFQGVNQSHEFTTLGRGGSDTTAVAVAAKLGYSCIIYTDVDGIYGIDPRIYKDAKKLEKINYEEMKEMASLGAKVMESRSIDLASRYNVETTVASSYNNNGGTIITNYQEGMETKKVTGIAVSNDIVMVSIRRIPFKANITTQLFIDLAKNGVNVDIINQNPGAGQYMNIAFTANALDIDLINEVLDDFKNKYPKAVILKMSEVFKLSLIGSAMRSQSGIAAEVFKILDDNKYEFRLVTTSEISISYTFLNYYQKEIVNTLARHFNL